MKNLNEAIVTKWGQRHLNHEKLLDGVIFLILNVNAMLMKVLGLTTLKIRVLCLSVELVQVWVVSMYYPVNGLQSGTLT